MNATFLELKPGDKFGKYKVLQQIGVGGSFTVYLAEHLFTKRKVVLKIFIQTEDARDFAYRQSELLASIDHPSIIRLHDADENDGYFYQTVDFIGGKSLWETVNSENKLSITFVLKLMLDLVDAIGYVHSQRIILVDIKPDNIIISSRGTPILADFMLIDLNGDEIFLDPPLGTISYMAPESWQGRWGRCSDLWSLGMTFHYLVTGCLPFEAEDAETIRKIVTSEKPLDLSALYRALPESVARIIDRCLEKNPEKRYQSAVELRRDIESALAYLELGQIDDTFRDKAPLSPGRTIMLNVDYKEPGIPGQYREYHIIEKLGQGSFSIVYRADDVIAHRQVALKILRQEKAGDEKSLVRFQQEASLLARLNTPNVVHVYNFGRYEADFFIVMDVLTGPTIKAVLECGFEYQVQNAAAIVAQILLGLERIHAEGIVHRDVKPENVMLQPEQAVLMDLGLAHVSSGEQLTMSGEIIGTPRYMAPEQARGDRVTFQSDLYSAGVILYELLTKKVPHTSDNAASLIFKIALEAPEPVTQYRDDLPLSLVTYLGRILSHDPDKRFPSARMAYEELLASAGIQDVDVAIMYREMYQELTTYRQKSYDR